VLGGFWSTYDDVSESELEGASEVELDQFNAQLQPRITWDPSFATVRAQFDQLVRADGIGEGLATQVDKFLARAERFADRGQRDAAVDQLEEIAGKLGDSPGQQALAEAILGARRHAGLIGARSPQPQPMDPERASA
jgi:hypothetical protein